MEIFDVLNRKLDVINEKISVLNDKSFYEEVQGALGSFPKIDSDLITKILGKKYDSNVVLDKVKTFESVMGCYDDIKEFNSIGGVAETQMKFLSDIESDIGDVLTKLMEEQDLFASYIESKRNILLLKECLNEFLSKDECVLSFNLEKIYKLLDSVDIDISDKVNFAKIICKRIIDVKSRNFINEEEQVVNDVSDNLDDVSAVSQVDSKREAVLEELQSIRDERNDEYRDELNELIKRVNDIVNDNKDYIYDFNNQLDRVHIDRNMVRENLENLESMLGVNNEYVEFIMSLYELIEWTKYPVEDESDILGCINSIKNDIMKFNDKKDSYLITIPMETGVSFDKFVSDSYNILLSLKDKDGKFIMESTLNSGTSKEIDEKNKGFEGVINLFTNIPYIADNTSDFIDSRFNGSDKDKSGGKIGIVYKNNPKGPGRKNLEDEEFGNAHKRFRPNYYSRIGYIVLPIAMENRKKLATRFENDKLLHSTTIVLFTGALCVSSNHSEYSLFNEILDNNRESVRKIRDLFANPNASVDELYNIVCEGMGYTYEYIKSNNESVRG